MFERMEANMFRKKVAAIVCLSLLIGGGIYGGSKYIERQQYIEQVAWARVARVEKCAVSDLNALVRFYNAPYSQDDRDRQVGEFRWVLNNYYPGEEIKELPGNLKDLLVQMRADGYKI
jgi:hypothetical protein